MSSLKARRTAVRRDHVSAPRPYADQLTLLRGALIHAARQPDSAESRATLRALALASVFVVDSMSA